MHKTIDILLLYYKKSKFLIFSPKKNKKFPCASQEIQALQEIFAKLKKQEANKSCECELKNTQKEAELVAKLTQDLQDCKTKEAQLQEVATSSQMECKRLEESNLKLSYDIGRLNHDLVEQTALMRNYNAKLAEFEREKKSFAENISNKELEIEAANQTLQSKAIMINEFEKTVLTLTKELNEAKTSIDELSSIKEKYTTLLSTNADLAKQISDLQERTATKSSTVNRINTRDPENEIARPKVDLKKSTCTDRTREETRSNLNLVDEPRNVFLEKTGQTVAVATQMATTAKAAISSSVTNLKTSTSKSRLPMSVKATAPSDTINISCITIDDDGDGDVLMIEPKPCAISTNKSAVPVRRSVKPEVDLIKKSSSDLGNEN